MYDYIITGAGASGLSLLVHMVRSGAMAHKKILLVEKSEKTSNDRTWCFWEKTAGPFEEIVSRRWQQLWFHGTDGHTRLHNTEPYTYKLIRGLDFYNYCFDVIRRQANITVLNAEVTSVNSDTSGTFIIAEGKRIDAHYIFNSLLFSPLSDTQGSYLLLQHFKGWFVKTAVPAFDPGKATLMDFRVAQDRGTAFVYLMPFDDRTALVEYTMFSKSTLEPSAYDNELRSYCATIARLPDYEVLSEEFGIIPMTNHQFPGRRNNIINIGTAGGQTKGSSGYTFTFIQKHSAAIIKQLLDNGTPFVGRLHPKRFEFFDAVLLNILYKEKYPGGDIFTKLFRHNNISAIFRFLDNESALTADLKLIAPLPTAIFLRAAIGEMIMPKKQKSSKP